MQPLQQKQQSPVVQEQRKHKVTTVPGLHLTKRLVLVRQAAVPGLAQKNACMYAWTAEWLHLPVSQLSGCQQRGPGAQQPAVST